MLETLEDRDLLSATTVEPFVPPAVVQAESYAAQEVMHYISSYESSIEQMVGTIEQQSLLAISRVESMAQQLLQQFIPQSVFPIASTNSPSVQPSSMAPAQPSSQRSPSSESNTASAYEAPVSPIGEAVPIGEVSPAGGSAPAAGDFSPSQIIQAYGFNQISFASYTGSTLPGAGQTIAIVDAYSQPNIVSDLQSFDSYYGIAAPQSFNIVNQAGGTTLPAGNGSWGQEETADVELAHAIAPGANILLVEANSYNLSDLYAAVQYAASQPGVSVVSMSWGSSYPNGEYSGESSEDSIFTTPAGHNGVTFVAASGDHGTASGYEPQYPSTSPNVLAVGGTMLTTDSAGDYESEQGWSGSGGGISAYEALPSYQPGTYTNGSTMGTSTMRMVPDVALNMENYAIYDSYSGGDWQTFAGTSAAAPIWASLIAIADQGRALNGDGTLDGPSQTLPAISQMPSSNFHDITTGNNGYAAGSGYDLVTGLGTPKANLVVNSLVSYDASSWQQQNLSSSYNLDGLTWGDRTISGGGIDGNNDALEGYDHFSWQGTTIYPGTPGTLDVVSAQGQTINLSASGQYSTLTLFATAVNGNQANQQFTVNYSSGPSQTFTRSFTNWLSVPGGYSDELKVMETKAFNPDDSLKGYAYFSAYALPVDPSRTATSITLPDDPNIVILAMELT